MTYLLKDRTSLRKSSYKTLLPAASMIILSHCLNRTVSILMDCRVAIAADFGLQGHQAKLLCDRIISVALRSQISIRELYFRQYRHFSQKCKTRFILNFISRGETNAS